MSDRPVWGYRRTNMPTWEGLQLVGVLGVSALLAACQNAIDNAARVTQIHEAAAATASEYMTQTAEASATAIPTEKPTESPTATETVKVEPRVPPQTINEIFPDQENKSIYRDYLEDFGGGYFTGKPEVENPEEYLWLDLSHQGQIRIVEATRLDDRSWGVYTIREKRLEDGKIAPNVTVVNLIEGLMFRYGDDNEGVLEKKDVEVVWGDLAVGTSFIYIDSLLDLFDTSGSQISREEILRTLLPLEDSAFTCTRSDKAYTLDGRWVSEPGTTCEYTG